MEQTVSWQYVGVNLSERLVVDVVGNVVKLVEQIKAVKHDQPFAAFSSVCEPPVPHRFGGVFCYIGKFWYFRGVFF